MADSYTVMWTNERCKWLEDQGESGKPLQVLFGGEHQSLPQFTRFGVKPGDFVYPVRVKKGILYIVARMKVKEFISIEDYVANHLSLPPKYRKLDLWDLEDELLEKRPDLGHLLPYDCIEEVAIGEEGAPIRFDREVPGKMLERIRYRSKRGERKIKFVKDGKLLRAMSIQGGVYRLSPKSAKMVAELLSEPKKTSLSRRRA